MADELREHTPLSRVHPAAVQSNGSVHAFLQAAEAGAGEGWRQVQWFYHVHAQRGGRQGERKGSRGHALDSQKSVSVLGPGA